ncbi:MAG: prepilin-type N-terminal cleavage/methylation domain-containing protein [Azoarcus sp.]|jgi:type IV pilus assembly protein PilE|nr:prepilin-type N-terminal cleavage/methylation domain-containing protein [Azoarcus sp.]
MKSSRGFTLIEILIALVVVAIIAAVAVPNYQRQIMKTRRAAAAVCLMELSQWMERFYTVNLRYDQDKDGKTITLPTDMQCQKDLTGFYSVGAVPGGITARAYKLAAVPDPVKQKDELCGSLTLDQTGMKGVSTAADPTLCWK